MNQNPPFSLILRSIVFILGQSLVTIFIASIGLIFFFCPFKVRYWWITRWSHFVIWWAKIICGINYQVFGLENLPKHNAIVLAKHQSAWETIFFQTLLPAQTWVLKKELLWIPFFGWALALLEPIAINRKLSSAVKQLKKIGTLRLKQGRWVIIFPEGTRVAPGKKHPYSRSGAALSESSGFPIVPIAHNAGEFWPKNSFIKRPGTIQVHIGSPIYPKSMTVNDMNKHCENWIEMTMDKISTR